MRPKEILQKWLEAFNNADSKTLAHCGFFQIKNDKIVFQRGYWDKLSFHKLHQIPLEL
jgi:limonene-1,2-epoxide hydrolase